MSSADRFVIMGERRLYARVLGSGPPIILIAGSGVAGVGAWDSIESSLSASATVVSYDRAGLGRSDPSASAPTATNMAADIIRLADALGLAGRLILVGRSLGALPAQLFACLHPARVAGLVLLDPTPDVLFSATDSRQSLSVQSRSESDCRADSCAEVRDAIETRGLMPDVPLTIISASLRDAGANSAAATDYLMMAHRHMAQRAPRGRLVIASESSHENMLRVQPELVIRAIGDMLANQTNG
jgi:pimeloyl-ACP methyl ester carboxylesterase